MSGPPPTGHHHFVQHFLRPGDYVQTVFTCTAPEDASCRMACRKCSDQQREACVCASLDDIPDMQDYGECLIVLWLNADAPEECYNDERKPVRGPEPQPITVDWDRDDYGWNYA